jgi:hypothetical protein
MAASGEIVSALVPRDGSGSQILCYGDSCSGTPDSQHSVNFALVNGVAARLFPPPELITFLGDEIEGLTRDLASLRAQWHYWLEHEMAWREPLAIPLYHVASNHTTYDEESEQVFREVLPHLPLNGPPGQLGLSYYIRHSNLLLVFVNTSYSGGGGDGWVETEWLGTVLSSHAEVPYKFVFGHQPVFPVNGYAGECMRELVKEAGHSFWAILIKHRVVAYVCSHMLAFDVQVHEGVLQILTAGAGTAHLLAGEYLHCLQMAIDREGLRYQVLDTKGAIRECLAWPPHLPPAHGWPEVGSGADVDPVLRDTDNPAGHIVALDIRGRSSDERIASAQTLVAGSNDGSGLSPLWVGLRGPHQQLFVSLAPMAGRSPQLWRGPEIGLGRPFGIQLALHTGMGPGGLLWRATESAPWSSLLSSAQWGLESITWPRRWSVGRDPRGRIFRGSDLRVRCHTEVQRLL